MDSADEEDALPYSERESWKDVTPVPQDDGPEPLAVIRYPKGFVEVHDYFRAIQQRDEYSQRALKLSADVIEQNSANYTAWYYRRRCLKELNADLEAELRFTNKWTENAPKNYQVWYHRRWLIIEIAEKMKKDATSQEDLEKDIKKMAGDELDNHQNVMMVNDDWKNYNGWSHRHFIVDRFNMWDRELSFVEDLLLDDIRNNSAWNHRYTVVKHSCWPTTPEVRKREVSFTLDKLRQGAMNESAWNYLQGFFGEGAGKESWKDAPDSIVKFCHEVMALASEKEATCRFAVETVGRIHEAKGETAEAEKQYMLLQEIDKIRAKYWEWRVALLKHGLKGGA
eukprot:TRINITY_DN81902_c0_g1_i1.p1 TRINITY_DN81902_c0_g1~~TRINITY_DN81902_c0_g1_i1.p1  ORF type:complete len:339 (+),score=104.46 TRINITY_DN81902_c0_g1_i1:88-1104(+)